MTDEIKKVTKAFENLGRALGLYDTEDETRVYDCGIPVEPNLPKEWQVLRSLFQAILHEIYLFGLDNEGRINEV